MSLKSLLPATAAVAIATLALAGCSMTTNVSERGRIPAEVVEEYRKAQA